jgi:hypothetical protein
MVSENLQAATTVPTKTRNFRGERARRNRTFRKERRSFKVPNGQNQPQKPRPRTSPYRATLPIQ